VICYDILTHCVRLLFCTYICLCSTVCVHLFQIHVPDTPHLHLLSTCQSYNVNKIHLIDVKMTLIVQTFHVIIYFLTVWHFYSQGFKRDGINEQFYSCFVFKQQVSRIPYTLHFTFLHNMIICLDNSLGCMFTSMLSFRQTWCVIIYYYAHLAPGHSSHCFYKGCPIWPRNGLRKSEAFKDRVS